MNISEPFIRRPVMTILIMVTILFLGLTSYFRLPVSDLPNVDYPTITVTATLPGASPETMANTVATPMEKEFMTIPGVTKVSSSNTLGQTQVILEFELNKNIDSAAQDVQASIVRAQANLPPNLPNAPTYKKVNPSDQPIVYIALTSETMPIYDLYIYAYTFIAQRLSMLNGVAQVIVYGSPYAVRVQVDPGKIATRAISIDDVAGAISQSTPDLPSGQMDGPTQSLIIQTYGQLTSAKEYSPIIVKYNNNSPVRVEDLGQVINSVSNERFNLRYISGDKDYAGVVLAVQRQPGANTVMVSDEIRSFLPSLLEQLPQSIDLRIVYDRSQTIRASIFNVKLTLVIAFFLVVLVIFLYLGTPIDTMIPSLAMPMSIIGTFYVMELFGFSIDNLSLLALTLSTGFIVDDAIVVLENIVRRIEEGESRWTASILGSKQISTTILSMTLSLAAVFIPLVYMGGLLGKILLEFSIVMIVVVLLSGFISLTLTPMLCSRLVAHRGEESHTWIANMSRNLNQKFLNWYADGLKWVLGNRTFTVIIGALSVLLSALLFYILPKDFIPDDDIGFIIAYTQAAEGTSPKEMFKLQDQATEIVRQDPSIESMVSLAGNPQIRNGIMFIRLKPHEERPTSNEIIQKFYKELVDVPGLNTFIKNIPLINLSIGPQSRGTYQYSLQSLDTESLYKAAEVFLERMNSLPGFQGISSDFEIHTPQLNVHIDRDQASALGFTAQDIENTLLLAYSGNRVAKIQTPFDQYDVVVETMPRFREGSWDLSDIYLKSHSNGNMIPLSALVVSDIGLGPASVNHLSQFPAVTISFNLLPGVPLGTALENLKQLADEVLPANVEGAVQGAAETFEETVSNTNYLLILAVFAIYIVLGILYESFIHPLTILSSIPPAILGGLLTLWIFGLPLSLYGYLGLLLLIGIVKKNGIMMIDFALDNIREKGETPEEAIYNASIARFRPIMMTTVAAIMGALPVALSLEAAGKSRQPLGLVIIGGLVVSQLITLFLTPVIYLYMEKYNKRVELKEEDEPEKQPQN